MRNGGSGELWMRRENLLASEHTDENCSLGAHLVFSDPAARHNKWLSCTTGPHKTPGVSILCYYREPPAGSWLMCRISDARITTTHCPSEHLSQKKSHHAPNWMNFQSFSKQPLTLCLPLLLGKYVANFFVNLCYKYLFTKHKIWNHILCIRVKNLTNLVHEALTNGICPNR